MAWEKTYGNGRDDVAAQMKNIQYTLDAVELVKRSGCSAFIGAGSQAEYGRIADGMLSPFSSGRSTDWLWNCEIYGWSAQQDFVQTVWNQALLGTYFKRIWTDG